MDFDTEYICSDCSVVGLHNFLNLENVVETFNPRKWIFGENLETI